MQRGSQIQGFQASVRKSIQTSANDGSDQVYNDELTDNMGTFDRRKYKNFMISTRNPVSGLAPVRTAGDLYYRTVTELLPGNSENSFGIHRPSRLNSIPTYYSAYSAPLRYGVRTPNGGVFRKKADDLQINDLEFV